MKVISKGNWHTPIAVTDIDECRESFTFIWMHNIVQTEHAPHSQLFG